MEKKCALRPGRFWQISLVESRHKPSHPICHIFWKLDPFKGARAFNGPPYFLGIEEEEPKMFNHLPLLHNLKRKWQIKPNGDNKGISPPPFPSI